MTNRPLMTGWAHSRFGKAEAPDIEALVAEVAISAIRHAGVAPADIDAIYVGVFNGGFSRQGFSAALVGMAVPELAHVPATRVENACSTGSAALFAAADVLQAGRAQTALVIGAEKMTAVPAADAGGLLLGASYLKEEASHGSFAGAFGHIAQAYFDRYGDHSDELAMIAAKNHANGVANPYAHMRKDLGFDFCSTVSDRNPIVAGPLRRTDCSLISDGAAAIVLQTEDAAASAPRAVAFRGRAQANDHLALSRRDPIAFSGATAAWGAALDQAGIGTFDLDVLETHDCFTIAELIEYEALGITDPGAGREAVLEGWTTKGGRLPVNPSGGLKAKGHPIGATGVSQHAMQCMQLTGEAGPTQIDGVELAGVFNMGGAAVANYASVLERVR